MSRKTIATILAAIIAVFIFGVIFTLINNNLPGIVKWSNIYVKDLKIKDVLILMGVWWVLK